MIQKLVFWLKRLQFLTPLRSQMVHRHDYFFWPVELAFLCEQIEKSLQGGGVALEVGCAQGATTAFLNKHLQWARQYNGLRNDVRYICLDTFSGFTRDDVRYEKEHRGKSGPHYHSYRINSPEWFKGMLEVNQIEGVTVEQGNAATFDYRSLGSIGFCLLDVDLYLPTIAALPQIYEQLRPGGLIIVDDCAPAQVYDGAHQAYHEFVQKLGMEPEVHHRKFGIIRKPL